MFVFALQTNSVAQQCGALVEYPWLVRCLGEEVGEVDDEAA